MLRKILVVVGVFAGLLTAAPTTAAAEPVVALDPDGPYQEGDVVTVSASGLTPGTTGLAGQCDTRIIGATSVFDAFRFCRGYELAANQSIGADGELTQPVTVQRFLDLEDSTVDCSIPGACLIGVGTIFAATSLPGDSAFEEIIVEGADRTITLDVTIKKVNAARARGEVRCSSPATVNVVGTLSQSHGQGLTVVSGSTRDIACDGVAYFSVLFYDRDGAFEAGSAVAVLTANTTVDGQILRNRAEQAVDLSAAAATKMPRRVDTPGTDISINQPRLVHNAGDLRIDLSVNCIAGENISINATIEQTVPLKQIDANSFAREICPANGVLEPEMLAVPRFGTLERGRAVLTLEAWGDAGRLEGARYYRSTQWVPAEILPDEMRVPVLPDSSIDVLELTTESVTFRFTCTGPPPFFSFLFVAVHQLDDRILQTESGPSDNSLIAVPPCTDTPMEYTMPIDGGTRGVLQPGPAVVRLTSVDIAMQRTLIGAAAAEVS